MSQFRKKLEPHYAKAFEPKFQEIPTIPLEACKHGYTYMLHSRNLILGIFNEQTKGFTGVRSKFESKYLFEEYHVQCKEFGSAKPLVELEQCPIEIVEIVKTTPGMYAYLESVYDRHQNHWENERIRIEAWTKEFWAFKDSIIRGEVIDWAST